MDEKLYSNAKDFCKELKENLNLLKDSGVSNEIKFNIISDTISGLIDDSIVQWENMTILNQNIDIINKQINLIVKTVYPSDENT